MDDEFGLPPGRGVVFEHLCSYLSRHPAKRSGRSRRRTGYTAKNGGRHAAQGHIDHPQARAVVSALERERPPIEAEHFIKCEIPALCITKERIFRDISLDPILASNDSG